MGRILKFEDSTVAWIAVLPIEIEATPGMLDNVCDGQFETVGGGNHTYNGGNPSRLNVVIATFARGTELWCGLAAVLVNWFAPLVSVAAGLPNLYLPNLLQSIATSDSAMPLSVY
jgi:hypothetical protein